MLITTVHPICVWWYLACKQHSPWCVIYNHIWTSHDTEQSSSLITMFFATLMINEYNCTTKFSKLGSTENLHRFMKVKDNLDFDEFLAEARVAQMGIFSNQAEYDAIFQLCSTISFFVTILHLSPNTILNIPTYWYLPWYIPWNLMSRNYWVVV